METDPECLTSGKLKLERLLRWRQGATPGPWTLSLFPTYRCNLQCRICWKRCYDEPLTRDEELSDDRLLALVDEAAELGVRYWIIGGGGELMVRDELIMDLCAKIRSRGMNGVLQTNGTRFTPDHLRHLIDVGWLRINISIDGPTAGINDAIRCEDSFERATSAIKDLIDLRRERGVDRPMTELVSVVTALNWDKIDNLVDMAHGLEASCLYLVELITYGDETKSYELTSTQRAALPEIVTRAQARAEGLGLKTNFPIYMRDLAKDKPVAMDLFSMPRDRVSGDTMCFEPFLSMVIFPSGLAGPCCTFWNESADSVRDLPLRDVWLGAYLGGVRKSILEGRPPEYCANCLTNQIFENQTMQGRLRWHEEQLVPLPKQVGRLIAKTYGSIRRHGMRRSFRRGREWLRIRRERMRTLD
jgi:MoaA/NifB/PqqE/SkfB family radical SAM enzyme